MIKIVFGIHNQINVKDILNILLIVLSMQIIIIVYAQHLHLIWQN